MLVGPNGVGKTNLVEAVGYLATLGSHRVATDAPLVRRGAERAVVRATVVHQGRELTVELEIAPGRANRARVNRAPVARPRDVLGILRTVLFAPEDLALVRGDPGERRRFLDDLLVARRPRFAAVRADYDRVLKQRSALLKTARNSARSSAGEDLRTLDVWDGHLARHGAALLAGRLDLVAGLATPAVEAFAEVAPSSEPIALVYRSSLDGVLPATADELEPAVARRARPGAPPGGRARGVPRRPAPRRSGAAARRGPGEGVRESRRVVGAGPRAAAGLLPAAVRGRRRTGADPRRRVRRAGRPAPSGAGGGGRARGAGSGHRRGRGRRA